jgi:predicted metal-dependent hydrolase
MNKVRDKDEFKKRVLEWAQKMDVKVHALAVRPMRNKWASCSTAGNLQFSTDLLAFSREVGDYVIVHELLHFFVHNHGKLWKSLMRAHLGDYERLEKQLVASVSMKRASPATAFIRSQIGVSATPGLYNRP